jgi:hypothetical protein
VQIEERLTKYINSTHNNIYLTKPVRRKKAKDFYNRFQRGLKGNHESRKDISKQKSHRNGPRTRSKKRISNHATLNSKQGTIYDGERVTVRSANPENIGQHVGRVVVLYGYIIKGYVANDYAILTVSYHHQEAKVILNEGFFANAPIGYINELNEFMADCKK